MATLGPVSVLGPSLVLVPVSLTLADRRRESSMGSSSTMLQDVLDEMEVIVGLQGKSRHIVKKQGTLDNR